MPLYATAEFVRVARGGTDAFVHHGSWIANEVWTTLCYAIHCQLHFYEVTDDTLESFVADFKCNSMV